jgi:hypothetical protein
VHECPIRSLVFNSGHTHIHTHTYTGGLPPEQHRDALYALVNLVQHDLSTLPSCSTNRCSVSIDSPVYEEEDTCMSYEEEGTCSVSIDSPVPCAT